VQCDGDGNDIDFAVDVIALFQHRAKWRRAAGRLEYDRAIFAPLVARVLAVGNAWTGLKSTSNPSSLKNPLS